MFRSLIFPVLLLTGFAGARAQEELTADEMVEGLDKFIKEKNDQNAIGLLALIESSFSQLEEGDQKQVVKAVEKALGKRREEGDNELYVAALQTMGKMGELGRKATTKALKNNNVKKRPEVLGVAIQSLASHREPRDIDPIVKFLVHSENSVVAAAATALGEYHLQEEKVRKQVVEEVVKNYANAESLAESRPREPVFAEKLAAVERPMRLTLEKLTGQSFETAAEWQDWYNDNKRKPWATDQ